MLHRVLPGLQDEKKWKLPLRLIGAAVSLCILFYYRQLFFQESLLTNIPVEVPFENRRPQVFVFLVIVTLLSLFDALFAAWGKKRSAESRLWKTILAKAGGCALIFGNAALCFYEVELVNNYYFVRMKTRYIWLGIFITLAICLFLVLVFNSLSAGMFFANILFMVWGLLNYFVQQFRGIPFQWIDFGAMRTGLSVSGNYQYVPTWQIIAVVVLTAAICGFYLHRRIWHNFRKLPGKIISRAAALAVFFIFTTIIFKTDYLADQGIWLRDWQPWYTYRLFGMEAGFFAFAKASYPQAPDSYSAAEVSRIIRTSEEKHTDDVPADYPVPENIICIMNEAFSDFSVYPNFSTDVPLMENIESLKENTQSGHMMASVKGGLTANTEYEFLTGNSCVLSPSTVVFNSFIKQDQFSIAKILGSQGYKSIFMHPYSPYGWNRNVIYPRMGFDEFLHSKNYYQGAEKIRGFVSDRACYEEIIRQVEEKAEGEKLFIYNITMQNHSSYKSDKLTSTVDVVGFHGSNEGQAEQYCTLVRMSDEAVMELIDYFSQSDQKTLICFWGDHQPEIGDDFWEYCYGKSLDQLSFEEQQLQYLTKYFIWANYDIPEAENQVLSANYLSSYLLTLTGLENAPYNDFLLDQRESIPAMNSYGYLGTDGKQHEWYTEEAGSGESAQLEEYKCLIYNELTAGSRRDAEFFGLSPS